MCDELYICSKLFNLIYNVMWSLGNLMIGSYLITLRVSGPDQGLNDASDRVSGLIHSGLEAYTGARVSRFAGTHGFTVVQELG